MLVLPYSLTTPPPLPSPCVTPVGSTGQARSSRTAPQYGASRTNPHCTGRSKDDCLPCLLPPCVLALPPALSLKSREVRLWHPVQPWQQAGSGMIGPQCLVSTSDGR